MFIHQGLVVKRWNITVDSVLPPGEQLKKLRNRIQITTREVEEYSRTIASDRQNEEFYISNAWLTQLENKDSVPSIYKLYSLSVIYRTKFSDLLAVFGIDLGDTARFQFALPLEKTHLASVESLDTEKFMTFPVRFDRGFSLDTTNLIARMVEIWGEIPIALLQTLDMRLNQYGYIGTSDIFMSPLLRPGSFVQIDSRVTRLRTLQWRTEFDRPIYFVELRDGYACSWCDVHGGQIILVPHPSSGCATRQFAYPSEAEIIGQVTGVAMRLVDPSNGWSNALPKLP